MRISRIYCDAPLSPGAKVTLSPERSHYVQQVLRCRVGTEVRLFNSKDGEWCARISQLSKNAVELTVEKSHPVMTESPLQSHLAQGLSRGDRMDFVIQKATEMGVSVITPILSQYCEVRLSDQRSAKKLHHWREIAISACEQCGRTNIPIIQEPIAFAAYVSAAFQGLSLVADPDSHSSLPDIVNVNAVRLLIGPEGGFSEEEITFAKLHHFSGWSFGPRILRTETAPITALSLLQSRWGDL